MHLFYGIFYSVHFFFSKGLSIYTQYSRNNTQLRKYGHTEDSLQEICALVHANPDSKCNPRSFQLMTH